MVALKQATTEMTGGARTGSRNAVVALKHEHRLGHGLDEARSRNAVVALKPHCSYLEKIEEQ